MRYDEFGWFIEYIEWLQVIIPTEIEFLSLKIVLVLANSVDPDEMPHYGAFHLGLHCLLKNPFRGFQYTKGYLNWNFIYLMYMQWSFFYVIHTFCDGRHFCS